MTAAIAVSIASVTGVTGAADLARRALGRDSRVWLGGDLAADTAEPISSAQIAALNGLRARGIDWTFITWMPTTASSSNAPDPIFLTMKVVDPPAYPFYGTPTLEPPQAFADALRPDSVVISRRVVEKLHVDAGGVIRIGAQSFTVAAVITAEPERSGGVLGWGPRCILSRQGFARLAATGNARTNRILLRLPPEADPRAVRLWLQTLIPDARVLDYRDAAAPEVARMELVISFAGVCAFLALALGAIGVSTAVRLNLEQRIETLARLRVLGASSWQMAAMFVVETAAMLAAGLATGIPLGCAMRAALVSLAGSYLVLPQPTAWAATGILETAFAGAAILAPVLAGPGHALHRLRPLAVLRGERVAARAEMSISIPFALIAMAGFALIGRRLILDGKAALVLVTACALSAAIAAFFGATFLACARRLILPLRRAPLLKHALIGLCRAKSGSLMPIVCVSLGVMAIAATFQSAGSVVRAVSAALPYPGANLLLIDFEDSYRETIRRFFSQQPGVERVELITESWLRVASVDGQPREDTRYLVRCRAGSGDSVSIAADLASHIGVHTGSQLEFETPNGTLRAHVRDVHDPSPEERFWYTLELDCRELPPSSLVEAAAIRVRPERLDEVRRAASARYPTLASITDEEVRSTIRGVTADAMAMLRLLNWMAAAGGLLILLAVVAASRAARSEEIAIFGALGASRRLIVKIYSLEFAALGAISGVIGALLGSALNGLILTLMFHRPQLPVSGLVIAGALIFTPMLTLAAGWLPVYGLIDARPFHILRHERI